jgi:predicted N-acetyltransferase YhbS
MAVKIRNATPGDAASCGRIIYEAFKTVADRYGFASDFPSAAAATEFASALISHPNIFAVVAEADGRVAGSDFLWERDPISGVGPLTIDPRQQGRGLGRQLTVAILERAEDAVGVRGVADAFNIGSIALYASLGFVVREPLLLLQGTPTSKAPIGAVVRPLVEADVGHCETIARDVHGYGRGGELGDALKFLNPFVVERDGRIRGYLTMPTFWSANHAVAETEEDMRVLILGAAAQVEKPLSLLMPARQAELFRWCLSEHLRVVKPMTLMTIGPYQEPKGAYFPSVFY